MGPLRSSVAIQYRPRVQASTDHADQPRPARAAAAPSTHHAPLGTFLLELLLSLTTFIAPWARRTERYSNGMVEGFVNKVKMVKRIMFGKAGFPLLRQRVLHAL